MRCQMRFATAEELFNHLCVHHVGRKRHGNLSLLCCWEACEHKAAKRDHMTSHMMVHCPLQTNVCGICSKTFKRSYDLRKHEVTHTSAHHETHTRSRALIYDEEDGLAASVVDGSHRPELFGSSSASLPTLRSASARGNSSSNNNKPYLRPGSSTSASQSRRRSLDTSVASIGLQVEGYSSNPYKSFNSLDPIPYPLVHDDNNQVIYQEQPSVHTSTTSSDGYYYSDYQYEQAASCSSFSGSSSYPLPAAVVSEASSLMVSFPGLHSSLNDTLGQNELNGLTLANGYYLEELYMCM